MRFEVLGPIRISRGGVELSVHAGTQRRILAALLARGGHQISASELIDALWPADPPANAARNVQSYVAKLRHTLDKADSPSSSRAVLLSAPGGYALRLGPGGVDSQDFTESVRRASEAHQAGDPSAAAALLDRALRLWRGRPYGDLHDWAFLQPEIARLDQVRLQAFELGLELGRYAEVLPGLSACLEDNPYQEQVVGLAMRALYASGRQAEAQELFRETRTRLVENLGIEPTADLQNLYRSLLRGEADLLAGWRSSAGVTPLDPPEKESSATESASPAENRPIVLVDGMPARPKIFQSRAEEFGALQSSAPGPAGVISLIGPRGAGKSQLAAASARVRLDDGWNVIWLDAESREQLLSGLTHLADALGLRPMEADSEYTARRIRRWLSQLDSPSLLIFDNATEHGLIREWLPSTGSVQTIITTNRRTFGWLGDVIEMGAFTVEQAREFLQASTGRPNDMLADRIIEAVGGLPLALAVSAALIANEHLPYEDYLARLDRLPIEHVLAAHEADPYPRSVTEAVHLSLSAVEHREPESRLLIELISVLSPAGTAQALVIPESSDLYKKALRSRVLGLLVDASLLTRSQDGGAFLMHRLTRRIVAEQAAREGRISAVLSEAVRLLDSRFRALPGDRHAAEEVLQHVESLTEFAVKMQIEQESAMLLVDLGANVVESFHDMCNSVRVNSLNRTVLDLQDRVLVADHPAILRSKNRLAREYRQLGKTEMAVSTLESTLSKQQEQLGPLHPDTLKTRFDLASTLLMTGQVAKSITLLEQVAGDEEQTLGRWHTRTLLAHKRLAWARRSVGDLDSALQSYAQVVEQFEESVGKDHALTLRARSELACVYRADGAPATAIGLLEQILTSRERTLGSDHPDTLHDRDRLAGAYRAVGRYEESIRLFQKTLSEHERTLGEFHPWTLNARNNLGCAHDSAEDSSAALPLLERALAEHQQVMGELLPRTLNVLNNLACAYFRADRLGNATTLLEQTVSGREHALGPDHPDTVTSAHNLAVVYAAAGRDGETQHLTVAVRPLPRNTLWQCNAYAYGTGHGTEETIQLPDPALSESADG